MTSPFPKIVSLLFILVTLQVSAQQDTLAIKYATTISTSDLKDNLTIIASDALEGRETGKRGQKMAAAFIASAFQELGLSGPVNGSYYQPVPIYKAGAPTVSLIKDGVTLSENEYVYAGTNDTGGVATMPILFVGNASQEATSKMDVNAKAVALLTNDNSPLVNRAVISILRGRGARIIFLIVESKDTFAQLASVAGNFSNERFTLAKPVKDNTEGLFFISAQAAEKIFGSTFVQLKKVAKDGKAEKIKPSVISYSVAQNIIQVDTENVLGYLEGTDKKDELLVITAHYDHIGISENAQDRINNGADDDGSGTVAVLALAKAFSKAKKEGHGPRRSILFMAVTGEEKGLLGSLHYTNNPIFPLEKTVVDLNIDMIGRRDPQHKDSAAYVYIIGSDKLSSDLHTLSENINNTYTKLVFDYTYNDQNHPEQLYYRSDHWNFAQNNIPIIFYFDGIHEDYHMPSDEVDKIEFDLLMQRTKTIFHTAWEIANRESRLVVDKR